MRLLTLSLSIILASCFNINAQEKLSGHINTGLLVPFNDFSDNSFQGVKPNGMVGIGLGYDLPEGFRLRGDLNLGTLNGDNDVNFYETTLYEGHLFAEYDLLPLIQPKSKFKVYVNAGTGLVLYYSKLFDVNTRERITESPIASKSSFSINPMLSAGFNLGYTLTENLTVNLGYTHRLVLFNDFMDSFESGSSNDSYGGLNVGMTFTFKKVKDRTKVEIDKKKYNKMISSIDSLDNVAQNGSPEKIAKLEMESQEKDLRIRSLESAIDSLNTRVVNVASEGGSSSQTPADAETILSQVQYRIIVGSMPSRERATKWISRSNLDKSEMVVLYVDDIETYRIIYKSFDSFAAAKKALPEARKSIADAWIIKL